MALLMFAQSFAGALFLSFADTIFTNSLKTLIPQYAPGVAAQVVIEEGATRFREVVKGPDLVGVLVAYSKSVDRTFYLMVGGTVASFAFGWGMGWKDIRVKKVLGKV